MTAGGHATSEARDAKVRDAEAALANDACDRVALGRLAAALDASGRPAEALDRLGARPHRCDDTPGVDLHRGAGGRWDLEPAH